MKNIVTNYILKRRKKKLYETVHHVIRALDQ